MWPSIELSSSSRCVLCCSTSTMCVRRIEILSMWLRCEGGSPLKAGTQSTSSSRCQRRPSRIASPVPASDTNHWRLNQIPHARERPPYIERESVRANRYPRVLFLISPSPPLPLLATPVGPSYINEMTHRPPSRQGREGNTKDYFVRIQLISSTDLPRLQWDASNRNQYQSTVLLSIIYACTTDRVIDE